MEQTMKKVLNVAVAALVAASLSGCWITGDGDKTGFIVKVAQEGSFHDTWEAEMIRGGISNGTGATGSAFHFTIEDETLVPIVKEAADKNLEVKVHYKHEKLAPWRSQFGNNFVTKVEIIGKSKETGNRLANTTVAVTGEKSDIITKLLQVQGELLQVQARLLEQLTK
jgi:hypothetical protein